MRPAYNDLVNLVCVEIIQGLTHSHHVRYVQLICDVVAKSNEHDSKESSHCLQVRLGPAAFVAIDVCCMAGVWCSVPVSGHKVSTGGGVISTAYSASGLQRTFPF